MKWSYDAVERENRTIKRALTESPPPDALDKENGVFFGERRPENLAKRQKVASEPLQTSQTRLKLVPFGPDS